MTAHCDFRITTVIAQDLDTGALTLVPGHDAIPESEIAGPSLSRFRRLFRSLWRLMLPCAYEETQGDVCVKIDGEGVSGPKVLLFRFTTDDGYHWSASSPPTQYLNAYEMRLHAAELLEGADIMDAKNATEQMLRETLKGKR